VVCDLDRFEVHTNFTATPAIVHAFSLRDLLEAPEQPLRVLRAVMAEPEALRPGKTREELTREAAGQFASLAFALRSRGHDPQRVAHFLNKVLFCMFAQDAGILPVACWSGWRRAPGTTWTCSPWGCATCSPRWPRAAACSG
jgi:hypothetical protein